jgi:hypothetical protein
MEHNVNYKINKVGIPWYTLQPPTTLICLMSFEMLRQNAMKEIKQIAEKNERDSKQKRGK